jgi:hypothetical protein
VEAMLVGEAKQGVGLVQLIPYANYIGVVAGGNDPYKSLVLLRDTQGEHEVSTACHGRLRRMKPQLLLGVAVSSLIVLAVTQTARQRTTSLPSGEVMIPMILFRTEGVGAFHTPQAELSAQIRHPKVISERDDAPLVVELTSTLPVEFSISLESTGLAFKPASTTGTMGEGSVLEHFVFAANGAGNKIATMKVSYKRLRDSNTVDISGFLGIPSAGEEHLTISVEVQSDTTLGMTEQQLKAVQVLAAAVGLPSLVATIFAWARGKPAAKKAPPME